MSSVTSTSRCLRYVKVKATWTRIPGMYVTCTSMFMCTRTSTRGAVHEIASKPTTCWNLKQRAKLKFGGEQRRLLFSSYTFPSHSIDSDDNNDLSLSEQTPHPALPALLPATSVQLHKKQKPTKLRLHLQLNTMFHCLKLYLTSRGKNFPQHMTIIFNAWKCFYLFLLFNGNCS